MDPNELIRNIESHPLKKLQVYDGHYVAWSEDGKEILGHAPTLDELFAEVDRKGITRYVIDSISANDEVELGGAGF